jgi:hypothetical protein
MGKIQGLGHWWCFFYHERGLFQGNCKGKMLMMFVVENLIYLR